MIVSVRILLSDKGHNKKAILEYASNIWSPTQIGLIDKLESVQFRDDSQSGFLASKHCHILKDCHCWT